MTLLHNHRTGANRAISVVAMSAALALAAGCTSGEKQFARAMVLESLDQAIGGPTANARVGDLLLENDQIRVIIEQGGTSYHPADVGGTIIDIDLRRPEAEFRAGNGLDQLGQIAPIANLQIAQATFPANVRVTGSANGAEVTTAIHADPVYRILDALTLLLDQRFADDIDVRMYNEYEVRPGERMMRVITTVGYDVDFCRVREQDNCPEECDDALYDDDCECPALAERCIDDMEGIDSVEVIDAVPLPDRPVSSLLDAMLGDLPRPLGEGSCLDDTGCNMAAGETCVPVTSNLGGEFNVCRTPDNLGAGVFYGDLLIFGGGYTPFIPGAGYDTETDIRRLFDQGEDTLAQPLDIEAIYATGDRVSLGYISPQGRMQAPLFRGPFSLGATHASACPTSDPACLSGKLVRFERWISVGEGDVASAQEPIREARDTPYGTIVGRVLQYPDGTPMSKVPVYAMTDPRSLPCEGDCESDATCAIPDGEVDTWTLDMLLTATRCRTRAGVFTQGTAGVVSFALTDAGTDRDLDGDYKMNLPPGEYVLIAIDSYRAQSSLAPIAVVEGETVQAPLALAEPGVLEYAIFDEWGEMSPGRVTVGTCLPNEPCDNDSQCPGEDNLCQAGQCACEWPAFVPLEMDGARPRDGVIARDQTSSGWGKIELPPGEYEVVFSRGPHYSIDRQSVIIDARLTTQTDASVRRVVDRIGWASANFHIHTNNSVDSGTSVDHRLVGSVAEDLDFLSSSDHDWVTQYDATLEEMGLSDMVNSQVGLEITTQEYGHYLAFPIRFESWDGDIRLTSNNAVQWRNETPQEIIDLARQLAVDDLPVLIDIPHPYDYFEYYRLDSATLEPTDSLLSVFNDKLETSNFTGDFEALELVNSKSYSRIRRPTLVEIQNYSQGLDALIAQFRAGMLTSREYERAVFDLSLEATRERLHRTQAEQQAFLEGAGADVDCSCGGDGDCAAGLVCDRSLLACVRPEDITGDPPISEPGLCRKFRGVIDDWFNMLNRGVVRTGVSGADAHGRETGIMRTFVRSDATTAPYLTSRDVIDSLYGHQAIVSNGPMVHFTIDSAGVGDTIEPASGQALTLRVRIEKAHWYDVDRVEIYRNGELIHWARGCQSDRGTDDPHGHACMQTGDDAVVVWDEEFQDTPERDSWYVVMAYGLDGRSLAPVYGTEVLSTLGTPEITQRLYDIIPILREFRNPRYPSVHPVIPFGFTNPIFVDLDGNGWEPLWEPPSWCIAGVDFGC